MSPFIASLGACVLDPRDWSYVFFGGLIPQFFVDDWSAQGQAHIITEAELLPVLLARLMFRHRFAGRPLLCFIDNEAARHALVKAASSNDSCAALVEGVGDCDLADGCTPWYARVPSPSNLADDPSRLLEPAPVQGFRSPVRVPITWECFSLLRGPSS